MSTTTLPTDLTIPATVAAMDAATTRDDIRQILDNWRATHWDAWATAEAACRAEEADIAKAAGFSHLLESDGTWRVDYLPADIHHAELRALSRLPADAAPAVYYRTRA